MRRAAMFLVLLTGCATTPKVTKPQGTPIPAEWLSVPRAAQVRAVQLDAQGGVTIKPQPRNTGEFRVDGNRIMRGEKALTEAFREVESFDVSESRGEVVFSAKREDNFDIGLVSTDGSPISWVPSETVDETTVQWAPRGNKISFVVRSKTGDFVRTVHIPTATPLVVDFPNSKIEAVGWDPAGERFAVAYSTPDASDRVETVGYTGRRRRTFMKPAEELAVNLASFAPQAVSLRPREMDYNEKVPLVIWLDDEVFGWSDARAYVMRTARVAMIVVPRLDESLWKAIDETPWIDQSRAFVVAPQRGQARSAVVIFPDASLPAGHYHREGNAVAAPPAVVQSFAARFIADELKGTGPPNGSSR